MATWDGVEEIVPVGEYIAGPMKAEMAEARVWRSRQYKGPRTSNSTQRTADRKQKQFFLNVCKV